MMMLSRNARGILSSCLPLNKLMALYHSTETHRPIVCNIEDGCKVLDEMLHLRPLPSVVHFNHILGQLVELKHYAAVISLNRQMGLIGIAPDQHSLSILVNCYCNLNRMWFGLSVLGNFFKLGFHPDVIVMNSLIHVSVLNNQVAEVAEIFTKILYGRHGKPDVVTLPTLMDALEKSDATHSQLFQAVGTYMKAINSRPKYIKWANRDIGSANQAFNSRPNYIEWVTRDIGSANQALDSSPSYMQWANTDIGSANQMLDSKPKYFYPWGISSANQALDSSPSYMQWANTDIGSANQVPGSRVGLHRKSSGTLQQRQGLNC